MNRIFLLCILCTLGITTRLFSASQDLETLLWTSPSIEASETILTHQNHLPYSIQYLNTVINQVTLSAESPIEKDIRLFHLHYLQIFSYYNHNKGHIKKSIARRKINMLAQDIIKRYKNLTQRIPAYSDIHRIYAVSSLMFGGNSLQGKAYLLSIMNTQELQNALQQCITLNTSSPTCKIAYANYHTYTPAFLGADLEKGHEILLSPIQDYWPDIYKFEFHLSRMVNAYKQKNTHTAEQHKILAYNIYPDTWRIDYILKHDINN